jgi:hypothetical protein
MGSLYEYFEKEDHRIIDKWSHYFDLYERYFSKYKDRDINILEIGVSHGGSLQMWKNYFGKGAHIYGVDINPLCKNFEEEGIEIFIGSQADRRFLQDLRKRIPKVDILIDDGGHMMNQQIITFEELFDHVKDDGIYLCEDLHTSYWTTHGGGYRRRGTFIEYSKNLIDCIHSWHSRQKFFSFSKYSKSIYGLHFHDSVLVIEKGQISKPGSFKKGTPGFLEETEVPEKNTFFGKIEYYLGEFMAKMRFAKRF